VFGLKSRRKPPAGARPTLERDERIITWAPLADPTAAAGAVVVTTRGVFLPGRERLGWHEIHKATWSSPRLVVVPGRQIAEGDGYVVMADDAPVVVALSKPDDVPDQVRQRVTKSVAFTHHQPVPGGGIRVVGRRIPGRNGLVYHVRYDDGTDGTDPEVVAFTSELVAEAARPDESD
jgi:hypothetical protein